MIIIIKKWEIIWLKCLTSINILKELGFKHNNDFKKKIKLNENNYKNVLCRALLYNRRQAWIIIY
jgi:hypothetical protein